MMILKSKFMADQLRSEINSRVDRVNAINCRIEKIRSTLAFMGDRELGEAAIELKEVRVELRNHEEYIRKARQWLAEFYKCPIEEVEAA